MKRGGQVTIFIIIGIILVAVVAAFFLTRQGIIPEIGVGKETNPSIFLQTCMSDSVQDVLNSLADKGGFVNNQLNKRFRFSEETEYSNISLLCYTKDFYVPCVNQKPMYLSQINNEVKVQTTQIVSDCFDGLTASLEKQNDAVDATYNGFDVVFDEGKIIFKIKSKIILTNAGETKTIENFEIVHPTMFFNLAKITQEIISQEAEYCNFENIGYMAFNPKYNIRKFTTSDSFLIYRVSHRETGEQFKFGVRGCVRPVGL